ncbi:MAG: tetratricopeptide repeat protein [Ignavibacteria bacterium]|nr:tetratricopeptide repeat protein [Ignavibacteria bacterium]
MNTEIEQKLIQFRVNISEAKTTEEKARALVVLANRLREFSVFDEAKSLIYNAIELATTFDYQLILGFAKSTQGAICIQQGEFKLALALHHESLVIFENENDRYYIAISHTYIAMTLQSLGDRLTSIEHYKKASTIYEEIGNFKDLSGNLINIGLVYTDLHEYQIALDYFNRAISIFSTMDDHYALSSVYSSIGNIHVLLSDYQNAFKYLNLALNESSAAKSRYAEAAILNSIANIYNNLGDFDNAIATFNNSLSISNEINMEILSGINYNAIANIYRIKKNYETALQMLFKAKQIFEISESNIYLPNVISDIGLVYYEEQNFGLALECFRDAQQKYYYLNDKTGIVKTHLCKANVYSNSSYEYRDSKTAEMNLIEALRLCELMEVKGKQLICHESLSILYEFENDLVKALHHHKKYHELTIEVQSEEVKKQADKFSWERKLADMEKEREIELLKTEAEKSLLNETINHQKKRLETQAFEVENSIQELVKKNGLLQQIQSDIKKIAPHTKRECIDAIEHLLDRVSRHITPLDSFKELDKQWTVIHSCFIKKLQEAFPDLTTMELKIAVLLNMKFTSSNISSALFLAKRTVEFHRHNLRKKMKLEVSQDIYQVLATYSSQ